MKELDEIEKVEILGVRISNVTRPQLNDTIAQFVSNNVKQNVLHANIHGINIANTLPWYREFLNESAIVFCDGDGVRLGAKIMGYHIYEKITYNRWIWEFAEYCQGKKISWYLVGSEQKTMIQSVHVLNQRFPELQIVGYRNGFFEKQQDYEELIDDCKKKEPDILIIGMGMPLQEKLLMEYGSKINYKVALTGGAVFEYVSGKVTTTPSFFFKTKTEWLFRFFQNPRHLFRRYFLGNPLFMIRILIQKIKMAK